MDEQRRAPGRDQAERQHAPPVQGPQAQTTPRERTWAMFCHLAAFSALLRIPLGLVVGPLVVWLIKRKESAFVDRHGKAAVNFQLSVVVYVVGLVLIATMMVRFFYEIPVGFGPAAAESFRTVGLLGFRAPFGLGLARMFLPVVAVLVVLDVVCTIVAAVRANAGRHYRYPLAIRFIR